MDRSEKLQLLWITLMCIFGALTMTSLLALTMYASGDLPNEHIAALIIHSVIVGLCAPATALLGVKAYRYKRTSQHLPQPHSCNMERYSS